MSVPWNLSAVAALAVALGGCAVLGKTPPDTYELSAADGVTGLPARKRVQLLVPDPTAIKTLDSNQIVVKTTPYAVQYLGNSQWSDRLPRIVQLRMVQAFENTGRVGAVGVPGQGLAIDYQIIMEIRKFEIDASAPGRNNAQIEIAVKVLNDRNGTVRASRSFMQSAPVRGAGNAAFVAALDAAFELTARDIVVWTLRTV